MAGRYRSDATHRRLKIAVLGELGLTRAEIAAKVGVSERTVSRARAYWSRRGAGDGGANPYRFSGRNSARPAG